MNVFLLETSSKRVIWQNRALAGILGYHEMADDRRSMEELDVLHPHDQEAAQRAQVTLERGGPGALAHLDCRLRHADGTWRWFAVGLVVFERDSSGIPIQILGIGADITERKAAEEGLQHDATHDPLTGILNRRRFLAEVEARARVNMCRMSLCICDIDNFKSVNDDCGHAAGDGVLQVFAHLIRDMTGRDDRVARLGGDEFCLLLHGQTVSCASKVVDRIRREFGRREFVGTGRPFSVTASFGIAEFRAGMTAPEWLAEADEALYRAKREGRDRVRAAREYLPVVS